MTFSASHIARRFAATLAAALTACVLAVAVPTSAVAQQALQVTTDGERHAGEMIVPTGKSQILRVDAPFAELLVGNPEVADVLPLTDRTIYVLGKELGSTNLSIYGRNKQLLAVVDLVVGHDVDAIKRRIFDVMPGERVEIRPAADAVVLTGDVSSPEAASRAAAIAERYAPGAVTNLLRVRGSQQVMVQVRVAEVSRSMARELGIKPDIFFNGGDADARVVTLDDIDVSRYAAGFLDTVSGNFTLQMALDALESKGAVRILAEPNLVAMSGDTATFLAGGEVPIPVASEEDNDGGRTITVEYKEFGVGLAFTPTIVSDDLIHLAVAPEVSQIDTTLTFSVGGVTLPTFSTRRVQTSIELRDGQSFAIAGLLQSDFQDQVRQLPGFGDVPVLGALFRSAEYQRRETELVIIVTARLVKPTTMAALASPTDNFVPPSEGELFLLGRTEGSAPAGASGDLLGAQQAGGVAGGYGHIIR